MRVDQKHSHLNGDEYSIVHRPQLRDEVLNVIESVDADDFMTKISKERTMPGKRLYSPKDLNAEFKRLFREAGWREHRYSY